MSDDAEEEDGFKARRRKEQRKQMIQGVSTLLVLVAVFYLLILLQQGGSFVDEGSDASSDLAEMKNEAKSGVTGRKGGTGASAQQKQDKEKEKEKPKKPQPVAAQGDAPPQDVPLNDDEATKDDGALIQVRDLSMDRSLLNQPRLMGEVVNRSDETLTHALVEIQFLNRDKEIIHRRRLNPLVVRGGVFGDKVVDLKAGKVRRFGLDVKEVPPTWAGMTSAWVVRFKAGPYTQTTHPAQRTGKAAQ